MWNDGQFWRDASWRALRTFSQSLAALLVVVQSSSDIHIPWQGYLYSSGVAALISLLQSIDRGRAVVAAEPRIAETITATAISPSAANYQPAAVSAGPGCGGDMR